MDGLECPFCSPPVGEVALEDGLWYARWDQYPVSPGHLLIITRRHVPTYFEAGRDEKDALPRFLDRCKDVVESRFSPEGFNIGINVGAAAGQTVMHLHVHLIPRYRGDVDDPRGGVRGVVPKRRTY